MSSRSVISIFAATVLLTGCGDLNSSIWSKHLSAKRKEEAKEHWDVVRGGVKLQLARQNLEAGRLADAEKILVQAVALSPKDPQAFLLLAKLRLEQGQLADARQAINKATSLAPASPEIAYLSGVIAQRYGDLEMAAEFYTAAAGRSPNVVDYVLAQAETLVALDRPIDALALVESRISDFDTSAAMQMLAARICRTVGLRQPAVDHCREALQLSPDDQLTAADCGQIFVWARKYSDAISTLKPLLPAEGSAGKTPPSKRPGILVGAGSIRRGLASAYLGLNRSAEAMNCLKPVLADPEVDSASLVLCARAALNVEDRQVADRALALLRARAEVTPETRLLEGYLAFLQEDYPAAFEAANQAAKLDKRLVPALCLKGRSAQAMGKLDEARIAYASALALDPNAPISASRVAELVPGPHCVGESGSQCITPAPNDEHDRRGRFAP